MEIEGFQSNSTDTQGDSTESIIREEESIEITLTQSDFVNSDALVQSLFIYVLQKAGLDQKATNKEGSYYTCKHFQAEYSIGINQSLIVRIENIDPNLGGCQKISCKSRLCVPEPIQKKKHPHSLQKNRNTQSTNEEKIATNSQSKTSNNSLIFDWISKLLEFYPQKFTHEEIFDINQTISAAKYYLQALYAQVQQIKKNFRNDEMKLQKICEKRLDLMRKTAQGYIAANFQPSDFVSISYVSVDFSIEKQRMVEMEFNPGLMSLYGTHQSQFSSFLMRNKMQLCHKETNISDFMYRCIKAILFQKQETAIELMIPNQRLVLMDRIVVACDIQSVVMLNSWDKEASFFEKQPEVPHEAFDAVIIKRILISSDQIKQILDIRDSQQSLETVAQQETSMTYILQSENFFEKFYPEVKVKLERIETEKDPKEKKMCNIKIL